MPFAHVAFEGMFGARLGTTDTTGVEELLPEMFLLNVVHQMTSTPFSAATKSAF